LEGFVKLLLIAFLALPLIAQSVAKPDVQFNPVYPRDGQALAITWSQHVTPSARFGTPAIDPLPWGQYITYGQAHTITIRQTATLDGTAGESTDHEMVYYGPLEAGTYSVSLELTAGPTKTTFPLGDFVVAPACSPDASASATYSWDKSGYELHFEDSLFGNSGLGGPPIVTIDGNHVTVETHLTIGGIPPTRPTCISATVDLGAIAPGTYHLTWIYDESFAAKAAWAGPAMTRGLAFEAALPRRRTSRR
jgi:hypothetical protein